jgi:chromate transport protein ChrA
MSILLTRTAVVPMWLIVVGVFALLSPAPGDRTALAVVIGLLIVATALVVTFALQSSRRDRVHSSDLLTPAEPDAGHMQRLDSDKG